jgi:hypothetical protein
MGDAYRVAKQAYDKQDKTMATRDAGLTKEPVEAAEVHAAGSSHCGEIKSKIASSRDSTTSRLSQSSTTPLTSPFSLSPCSPPLLLCSSFLSGLGTVACTTPTRVWIFGVE